MGNGAVCILGDFLCIPKLCNQFWVIKHDSRVIKYIFIYFMSFFFLPFLLFLFLAGFSFFQRSCCPFSFQQQGPAHLGLICPAAQQGARQRSGTGSIPGPLDLIQRLKAAAFPRWPRPPPPRSPSPPPPP